MTETVRVWLVDRDYEHESMVKLVYATEDGRRHVTQQRSTALLRKKPVTAGQDVEPDRLEPVADDATRERYAEEAARVADQHGPEERI